ncbi:MAG: archease [Candidatus Omnitrophica bacterium]|nr:archease [Candidatus Omnitrophota bacterium]MDD5488280.1 archease [Candidatus Omnitrophota bacterium]
MKMKRYEQVEHTADLAARVYGGSLKGLFENAAFAMFDMMGKGDIRGEEFALPIERDAPDTESLLISWLNELLYRSVKENVFFHGFSVEITDGNRMRALAAGEKYPATASAVLKEIKAATYHDLEIIRTSSGYEATIVFDV